MKLDSEIKNLKPEEQEVVLKLLRGKATMHASLLLADCDSRIKAAVGGSGSDALIKAVHTICNVMTGNTSSKEGRQITATRIRPEIQDKYREIAADLVAVIEKHSGKQR